LKKVTNTVHTGHILELIVPNIFNNNLVITHSQFLGQYGEKMKRKSIVNIDCQVILQKEFKDNSLNVWMESRIEKALKKYT